MQGQLRALPAPAMPDAVAARLDAALADLRTERPAPDRRADGCRPGGRAGAGPAPPRPPAVPGDRRRLAAAVVVIAGAGAITAIVRAGGGTDSASSAGGRAASAPASRSRRFRGRSPRA